MRLFRIVRLAALSLLATSLISACTGGGQAAGLAAGARGGRQRPATVVSVVTVKEGKIATVLSYSGSIQPREQVSLMPKASGRIVSIAVDVGSVVKAGDVLAELDHASLDAQVQQAQANVDAAQAKLNAENSGGRPESIAAAQAALDSAQAKLDQTQQGTDANMQAAQAAVSSAQTQLDQAKDALAKLTNPTQDEVMAAKAALDKATAAVQQAQAAYDRVAYAPNISALPQATTLQQATADYQAALSAYNLKIKPRPEDVQAAQSTVASAQQNLASAQAKLDLLKSGSSADDVTAAQAAVDQAKSQLAIQKSPYLDSDIKQAQAAMAQAQAALEVAKAARADASIIAPFDGIVSQKLLDLGALAAPNAAVLSLVSKDVDLTLNIDEARISQFKVGQSVALSVPDFPGRTFPGKVTNVAPTADPKSHTFAITVAPDGQDGQLKAGMFANVAITTNEKDNAILVPRDALVASGDKNVVYVVSNGQAHAKEITIGMSDDTNVEAVSGVAVGDQVVIAGLTGLNDGSPVRIAGQQGSPGSTSGGQIRPSGAGGQSRPGSAGQRARPAGAGQLKPTPQAGSGQ